MKHLNQALAVGAVVLGLAFAQEPGPLRVGGNIMAANLISTVRPVYPPEAKQARIQGTVKLAVTVDKEGHVSDVQLVSGPAELIQSAFDSVKQWIYKPTLLNGEPVQVLTTIDVTYTLSE